MTAEPGQARSPAGPAAGGPATLRARAHASSPAPGERESGVTLRLHLEAAGRRADQLEAEVAALAAAGHWQRALARASDVLRAAMAREARIRPGDAPGLYLALAGELARWVRELPAYVAEQYHGDTTGGAR